MKTTASRLVFILAGLGFGSVGLAQDSSGVCDPLHPGYFTYVQERRDALLTSTSLSLYEPFGRRADAPVTDVEARILQSFAPGNGLQMPPCLDGEHFLPGRFQIGERSEIVIAFNPRMVKSLSGQVGRIDVSGKIIKANTTSQEIEIPGYREIGKATPAAVDQFSRSEKLVADVLLLMRLGEALQEASNQTLERAPASEGDASASALWALSTLYPNKDSYLTSFKNILANGDVLSRSPQEFTSSASNVLKKALTVAQMGKNVLEAENESLKEFREKIARGEAELESTHANWFIQNLRQLLQDVDKGQPTKDANESVFHARMLHNYYCSREPLIGVRNSDWCMDSRIAGNCDALASAADRLCVLIGEGKVYRSTIDSKALKDVEDALAAQPDKIRSGLKSRADAAFKEVAELDAVAIQLRLQRLLESWSRLMPSIEPGEKMSQLLALSRTSPYLSSFVNSLRDMVKLPAGLRETLRTASEQYGTAQAVYSSPVSGNKSGSSPGSAEDPAKQRRQDAYVKLQDAQGKVRAAQDDLREAVLSELRQNIISVEMLGFREIRLQPRVLGAADGDVIEITIRYMPPGAEATLPPGATDVPTTGAPTDGRLRAASWTLRFLLEKVGWYVLAGPRLSMNFSNEYTPEAENLHGTWGTLSLGVGADFSYFPGQDASPALRTALTIVSGVGLRVDQLDFDSRQATEFGIEGHVLLFKGMLTAGVGFNTAVYPTNSGRSIYYSVGLGLEQLLDEGLRLAEQSKR